MCLWWCFLIILGMRVAGVSTCVSALILVVLWVVPCGIWCLVSEVKKIHISIGRYSTGKGISGSKTLIEMKVWRCRFYEVFWWCHLSDIFNLSFSFFDTFLCIVFNFWAVRYRGIFCTDGISIGEERCCNGGIELRNEHYNNIGLFQFP